MGFATSHTKPSHTITVKASASGTSWASGTGIDVGILSATNIELQVAAHFHRLVRVKNELIPEEPMTTAMVRNFPALHFFHSHVKRTDSECPYGSPCRRIPPHPLDSPPAQICLGIWHLGSCPPLALYPGHRRDRNALQGPPSTPCRFSPDRNLLLGGGFQQTVFCQCLGSR